MRSFNNNLLLILTFGLLAFQGCSDDIEMDIAEVESIAVTKQATMVNIDPAQLCSDITLPNKMTGEMIKGTRDCQPKKPDCEKVGDLDCNMADKSLYGLKPTDLKPENIKEGVTIADVTGTMIPDQKACSADGETDCVTSAAFAGASRDDIVARVVENHSVGDTEGTFAPDLPPATAVLADDAVGGQAGQFPFCNDNQSAAPQTGGCALAQNQKAAEPATLNPADIKKDETINGTTGTFVTLAPNCSQAGATGCVTTGGYVAADKSAIVATNLLKGYDLLGVAGAVIAKPGVCNADGAEGCLAQGRFAAIDKSKLKEGILRSGITIGGVTGDFPSTTYPLAGAQGNVDDLTSGGFAQALASTDTFEFWDAVGQRHSAAGSTELSGDHILKDKNIFGVAGTMIKRPADCGGDFEADCVSTATFPAIKRSLLTSSIIRSDITIAGIVGQYPSLAYPLDRQDPARVDHKALDYPSNVAGNHQLIFWDVNGTAHTVAAAEDLTTAKVLKDTDILGVTGTAAAMPADCTQHNQLDCVARASAPAYKAADVTPAVIKHGEQVVTPSGTITGIFPSAAAPLAPLGDDTALTSGNFNANLRQAGEFVFWDATGKKHTANGDADLTAANLLNTITVFGLQGTLAIQPPDCNTRIDNCIATASRPTYDKTVLTDKILKAGVKVGNVTGTYPSSQSPLPENTEVNDMTLGTFQSNLSLAASFEYFDKAGNRYQGNGTPALTGPNIRKDVNLFGRIGSGIKSPVACTASMQDNCVVQGDYKTLDSTKISAANIKKGTAILGVTGTYPSAGNLLPDASDTTDLAMGNWNTSIASGDTFEFWTPAGERQTATGSADLSVANLKKGKTFYTVHGSMIVTSGNCSAAGVLGCTANTSFPSYDKNALSEGVVKKDATVLGVVGKYPSNNYPLTANSLPSLGTNFNAAMRQTSTFQYWDSAGTRYEGTGSNAIKADNIRKDQTIFGVTGTAIPAPDLGPWDVLYGTTYTDASNQQQTGKAKVKCRNMTDSAVLDTTGTDTYSTIDDYNAGHSRMPNQNPHGNDKYKCNGDAFEDVSYNTVTQAHEDCGGANVTCIYRDRIMGVSWLQAESNQSAVDHSTAEANCAGKTAGGHSDWRLPTQNEALMGYVHGFRGAHIRSGNGSKFYSPNFIWTSTRDSSGSSNIKQVEMAQGITKSVHSSVSTKYHCVR